MRNHRNQPLCHPGDQRLSQPPGVCEMGLRLLKAAGMGASAVLMPARMLHVACITDPEVCSPQASRLCNSHPLPGITSGGPAQVLSTVDVVPISPDLKRTLPWWPVDSPKRATAVALVSAPCRSRQPSPSPASGRSA